MRMGYDDDGPEPFLPDDPFLPAYSGRKGTYTARSSFLDTLWCIGVLAALWGLLALRAWVVW